MTAVVLGMGQPLAGDDGIGWVVARALAAQGLAVRESGDATDLLALLEEGRRVVVVDAVVGGGAPGDVIRVDLEALDGGDSVPVSSHGVSLRAAMEVARVLYGPDVAERVTIVGVVVDGPCEAGRSMSPRVTGAVRQAAALAAFLAAS